jgi:CheY-like chemotaxis protein
MPNGGTLSFEAVLKEPGELDVIPPIVADCYAVVTFTDTGGGMTNEVLKSAFEPFFTTKEIELGKGLGLPTVRKVASDHGGTAYLSSQVGTGTVLRIVLPVAELDEASKQGSVPQHPSLRDMQNREPSRPAKRTEESMVWPAETKAPRRVLVSQSDEALGRAIARSLRRAGYVVVWAPDAEQAVAAFKRDASSFDILLLDLDMADGEGQRAHHMIRKSDEQVPIVLLSGAPDVKDTDAAGKGGRDTLVRKPIEPAVLARVVQLALRRAGRGSQP